MQRCWISLVSAVVVIWSAFPALAYNPPVDRVGALTVRIEGPEEVSATDVAVPIRLILENGGSGPLRGTVEVGVIDRWTVTPAGPRAFEVAGRGTQALEFQVKAGKGTYNAHYPIHARARFLEGGKEQVAHPVLILQTKLPEAARAARAPDWRAFPTPSDGRLALWSLPVFRVVEQVFGKPPLALEVGRRGDDATGAMTEVRSQRLGDVSREAIIIHPPWRGGQAGTAAVEFPLLLPDTKPIAVQFTNGVTADGDGDGVTFRVRVAPMDAPEGELGEAVYERHVTSKTWGEAAEVDLSRFAGRAVRLQLESHPGPKKNTNFDRSFWGEPTLVLGKPELPPAFPPKGMDGSVLLGTIPVKGVPAEVRLWPGRRGLLDSAIGLMVRDAPLFMRGFSVRVSGAQLEDDRSPIVLRTVKVEPAGVGLYRVRHQFSGADGAFDLVGELSVGQGALRSRFALENTPAAVPWRVVMLEDVAVGSWSRRARQVYAGAGNVLRAPEAFSLPYDGHRLSTSFVGMDFEDGPSVVLAVDVPPSRFEVQPSECVYALHAGMPQTIAVIPTSNVFEGVKTWRLINGLKPSSGVAKAAGRFVFDLWGGRYAESAAALRRSFRYGLGDSMVVWHNWQRFGYDYRLPDIVPPNPQLGTLAEMQDLAAACRDAGALFAPHDNYIDFYPDADEFSYERNIAFHADGRPVRAWINEGRGAQSYRYRADRIETYLKPNVGWLKANLAPSAYFIDVWSSAAPYDYWTSDGQFGDRGSTRRVWGTMFAWIREALGNDAPQISESGHDGLIGWLDGAQTNHLRVDRPVPGNPDSWTVWDWRCEDSERTPWFDVAHHDRFILHGAGYSNRYQGGLDRGLHGIYSDDYMSTEVLTGHPGMVSEPFGHDVVRKHWLLNDLMRALAGRTIEAVEYDGGDLHRQFVRWSGGGEVWVNRGETDWTLPNGVATLPQHGFHARVPTSHGIVEASISRRSGQIVEWSRGRGGLYVNGRLVVDGPSRISMAVSRLVADGRSLAATLAWQADDPIPEGYQPFLHVCDDKGEIIFQLSQDPAAFRGSRRGRITAEARGQVPESVAPGTTLTLRVGLYDPKAGGRLAMTGGDDGGRRMILGEVRIEGEAGKVTGASWHPIAAKPDSLLARQNPEGRVVGFGAVATAGGVRVAREKSGLTVTALPSRRGRVFDARIQPSAFGWKVEGGLTVEAVDEDGIIRSRTSVRGEKDQVVITCRPEIFQYRLTSP